MFQFGKIVRVLNSKEKDMISADNNVLAVLEMWDDIILTALVHAGLNEKIKAGDYAITEVQMLGPNMMRHMVVKVMSGKSGEDTWKLYRKMYNKRNPQSEMELPNLSLDMGPSKGMIR